MIKKIFILILLSYALVVIEAFFSFFIPTRWMPDLCLLMVIFATLSLGFRYGFAAALIAGILKEGFSSQTFGVMLWPYLAAVYLTYYFRRRWSLQESWMSRLGIVSLCVLVQVFIQALFFAVHQPVDWLSTVTSVVVPQILVTLMISESFFNLCRPCASKLFV